MAILDYTGLFSITLHDDDVQDFDNKWDEVILSIQRVLLDGILESLYKMCTCGSDQFKTVPALYEQYIEQHNSQPPYQKLTTMVKRCSDQKTRARNFEARNERIETGALLEAVSFKKEARRVLSMKSRRTVHKRRRLQLPPR